MNWYKISQQHLLFNPFEKQKYHGWESSKVEPLYMDKSDSQWVWQCWECKKPVKQIEIDNWIPMSENKFFYPRVDKNRLNSFLQELASIMNPIIQQYNSWRTSNPTSSSYGYEVQAPPALKTLKSKYQELFDNFNDFKDISSFPIGNIFNQDEYNGNLIEYSKGKELNIDVIMNEIQGENFTVPILHPICDECAEKYSKCNYCDRAILPNERKWQTTYDDDEYACERCIDSGRAEICTECGKAESTDSVHFIGGEGDYQPVCDKCFEFRWGKTISWAEQEFAELDLPIGKNKPVSDKVINSLLGFFKRYGEKYGYDDNNWERIFHLLKKSGMTVEVEELLNFYKGDEKKPFEIIEDLKSSLKAQEYIKERYPAMKNFKDIPFEIGIVQSYFKDKDGFTVTLTPHNSFFEWASKKFPTIKNIWNIMKDTPHHKGVLAYARCSVDEGRKNLVINNLQRDADFERYLAEMGEGQGSEGARWIDGETKNWEVFLLDIIKSFCIKNEINAYLTSFDQQKQKWARLPIHKARRSYKEIPEMMGFSLENPGEGISDLIEDRGGDLYERDMYRVAQKYNWYRFIK